VERGVLLALERGATGTWSATSLTSDRHQSGRPLSDRQPAALIRRGRSSPPPSPPSSDGGHSSITTTMLMQLYGNPSLPRLQRPDFRRIQPSRNVVPAVVSNLACTTAVHDWRHSWQTSLTSHHILSGLRGTSCFIFVLVSAE